MTGSELQRSSNELHSQPQRDFLREWLATIVALVVFGGILLALLCALLAEQ
jgi:uncharacterized BrkB/YihY/UPF0761 family membrane protein